MEYELLPLACRSNRWLFWTTLTCLILLGAAGYFIARAFA